MNRFPGQKFPETFRVLGPHDFNLASDTSEPPTNESELVGGGVFLTCMNFGRMFYHSFPACTFLCVCFCFVFEVEISLCTIMPIVMPGSVRNGSVN